MTYAIKTLGETGDTFAAASHVAASRELHRRMRLADTRGMTAVAATGAVVHVEVADGQSSILSADGRLIYGTRRPAGY